MINRRIYSGLLLLICFGCSSKPKFNTLHISLVNNNRSVKFTGLDYAIMSEIKRDSIPGIWQSLIPVYRMPADTELKSYLPVQPGTYQLKDSAIVFTPDTPFFKNKSYFMRCYQFENSGNIWDYMKGKKKLGNIRYVDLNF